MSDEQKTIEPIWVNINQAARLMGYRANYIGELARTTWWMPENERPLKVRFRSSRYEFWLPDLVAYLETSGDPSGKEQPIDPEQVWMTAADAAEKSGYDTGYLRRFAYELLKRPESERPLKVRLHSGRYEFWLPDLIAYAQNIGHGPYSKSPKKSS